MERQAFVGLEPKAFSLLAELSRKYGSKDPDVLDLIHYYQKSHAQEVHLNYRLLELENKTAKLEAENKFLLNMINENRIGE